MHDDQHETPPASSGSPSSARPQRSVARFLRAREADKRVARRFRIVTLATAAGLLGAHALAFAGVAPAEGRELVVTVGALALGFALDRST